jgi:hypothetical protein
MEYDTMLEMEQDGAGGREVERAVGGVPGMTFEIGGGSPVLGP